MNQPTIQTRICGNPIVGLGVFGGMAFVGVQAFGGHAPWLLVIILGCFASYCAKCFKAVEAYRLWNLEWQAMAAPKPTRATGKSWLRWVGGSLSWLVILWLVTVTGAHHHLLVAVFWLGTVALIATGIWQARRSQKPRAKAARASVVICCLPVPQRSVDYADTYTLLPPYCQALLRR